MRLQHSVSLTLLIVIGLTVSHSQATNTSKEPPLKKGALVTVESYQPETKTYELKLINAPAVGPNIASREAFLKAIDLPKAKVRKILKEPLSIKGVGFNLKRDLRLLSLPQIIKRMSPKQRAYFEKRVKTYQNYLDSRDKKIKKYKELKAKNSKRVSSKKKPSKKAD